MKQGISTDDCSTCCGRPAELKQELEDYDDAVFGRYILVITVEEFLCLKIKLKYVLKKVC